MRRVVLFFGSSTLLIAGVLACGDCPKDLGGGAVSLDGSVPPTDGGPSFDGTVPDGATPDAATPDADAAEPPPTTVTVTVTGRTGPTANVRVVFHDASGAVLETKLTGADGKATSGGSVPPAMATALVASGSERHLVTWTGLEGGDDLALRDVETSDPVGTYDVTLPDPIPDAGVVGSVLLAGDCKAFGGVTGGTLKVSGRCVGTESAVLARAMDVDENVLGYSFKKANPVLSDGGVVAVEAGAWSAGSNVTVSATNISAGVPGSASLLEIVNGQEFRSRFRQEFNGNSTTFLTATGFADALQANVFFYPSVGSTQSISKRVAPTDTISVDASQVLPAITAATIGGTDARRPVLSWTSTSTTGTDGGIVHVGFRGAAHNTYQWTFVVPPGSTTVTAPAMPGEAESFLPANGDAGPTAFHDPEVVFIEADVLPGYTAFRRQQGALVGLRTPFGGFSLPATSLDGIYRATAYAFTL